MTQSIGFCYEPSFSSMPSNNRIHKKSVHLRIFPKNFIVTHRGLSIKDTILMLLHEKIPANEVHTCIRNHRHECSDCRANIKCRGHMQYINTDEETNEIQRIINE